MCSIFKIFKFHICGARIKIYCAQSWVYLSFQVSNKHRFNHSSPFKVQSKGQKHTPRCLKILGKEIGRDKDALGFTKGPPRMKNQQKLKSCLDKIQGFSKNFFDFSDFLKFFIKYKMSGIESYVEKVPKLLKSDECRGT